MTQAASKSPPQGSAFWRFSLRFYRAPEVASACIQMQDAAGVDVNLLFFLLWNASLKRRFSASDVAAVDRHIASWRQSAVIPLRNVRRVLKSAPFAVEPGAVEVFRTKVKGLELEAERLQQEVLYDYARAAAPGEDAASAAEAARANVAAYETFIGRPFPKPAVDAVLGAFEKLKDENG
ncbi:MAG: TIGR02444 family protein [Xanthobacteraceae bacterium]